MNALRSYIDRFEFDGDPLDVALRKLLMDVGLPRETQQIDRVMETFANRYLVCNQSLFISDGMSSFRHMTRAVTFIITRSSLYPCLQLNYASHGRIQQVQQTKDDEG
jgi:Sec7-like guanine-nucleotide exchange factor